MENLKKGDIITIFGISDWMASTTHSTFKATGDYSQDRPIFTDNKKGARKKFTLRALDKNDQLVFIGDAPFKADGEVSRDTGSPSGFTSKLMRGNACLNLVGDPDVIKDWILNRNINTGFTRLDSVIHISGPTLEVETPLFPDVPTGHAVVQGIRARVSS